MRNPLETLPEAGKDDESFDEIWEKALERWGVNSTKSAEKIKSVVSNQTADDTPEIIIDETHTDIKSELLFLLIEEAVLRIRNFEFKSVTVEPGKSHLTNAIAKTLGNVCESEDLLLMIAVDANKFTILKKGGINYTGRVMDEKKGYVFHSLLKNYPNAVTIK